MIARTSRLAAAALTASALAALGIAAPAHAAPAAQATPAAHAASAATAAGRLMLVMDASGSMAEQLPAGGGTKIGAARAALHDLAGALPADQAVGLRVFGATRSKSSGTACTDSQRIVDPATGSRTALDTAIDAVRPFGETPIGYALEQAAKDLGTSGQRTIVLVSDGEPTCSPDPCTVAARLAQDGFALRVDVVGLAVSGSARSKLQCIAAKGEGHYADADSAEDLTQALGQAAVRSAIPFGTSGTPVVGSNTRVTAPTVGDGDFTDTLGGVGGDRQTLYYVVHRAVADSTLHISVDSVATGESDQLGITLLTDDGRTCASSSDSAYLARIDPIINASVSVPRSRDASDLPCAAAGDFVVQVDHGYHNTTTSGRRADIPIELRVRQEPPVQDVEALPANVSTPAWSDPDLTGATARTAGGDSLNGATVLKPGTYAGSITSGEVQAFAVDLEDGQSLAAAVRVAVSPTLAQTLTTGGWPSLAVRLLSPSRVSAAGGSAFSATATNHQRGYGSVYQNSDGTVYYDYTDTVAYRNRFASSDDLRGASERGRYLIVVSLLHDSGEGRQVSVPFVLGAAVRGTASGAPQTATTATTAPQTDPTPSATPSVAAGGSGGTTTRGTAIGAIDLARSTVAAGAIGLGVLVLIGAGVLLIVILRRRPTDR